MVASKDEVGWSKCGQISPIKKGIIKAMHTYRHDLLLVRAAMLVRRFPLTQRGRLRDISVGVNGG